MVLSATELLGKKKQPTREEIQEAIGGNLCRCTGYTPIIDAIAGLTGSKEQAEEADCQSAGPRGCPCQSAPQVVGHSVERIDGWEKITGAARFADDIEFGPGLLHACIVESPHAHARIVRIDTSKAAKLPGVVKVVTGKDFPFKFGLYMQDRYIFAQDRVRFVGEQVAAVIACDPKIAQRAAALVEVEYEPLAPVFDPVQALEKSAPVLHPELGGYEHVPWFFPKAEDQHRPLAQDPQGRHGQGLREADVILEDTYRVPRYAHCAIEPHAMIGLLDSSGRLTMWTASQSPFTQRHLFAQALAPLGLSHKDIRVITPYVGGGFGGKAGVSCEILAAALATTVKGQPVKVMWSRAQEFYNTYQRQGVVAKVKLGVKKDGAITALEHTLWWDAGAYVEYGANVVNAVGLSATGPYKVDNVKIDSVCVYTNLPPGGPYRGFGYSEFFFGLESEITRAAQRIGMDPVAFRRKNAITRGRHPGLRRSHEPQRADRGHRPRRRGHRLGQEGKARSPAQGHRQEPGAVLEGAGHAAQRRLVGVLEVQRGCQPQHPHLRHGDRPGPFDRHGADRFRDSHRAGVEDPRRDPGHRPQPLRVADRGLARHLGLRQRGPKGGAGRAPADLRSHRARPATIKKDDLYLEDEKVKCRTQPGWELALKDFVIGGIEVPDHTFRGGPIMGRGMFMPEFSSAMSDPETGQGGHPNVHYTTGAGGIVIEVDTQTGKTKILKAALAVDVGKAINPDLIKGQITGGLLQGLATVLYEDMRFDEKGRLLNPSFADYKIPTALDIPAEVIPLIVESPQPDGPFGARGMGEHTMIPAAAMVANAIEDATGVRLQLHAPDGGKGGAEIEGDALSGSRPDPLSRR